MVDKFTYLHALLEGTAAWSIQVLALTKAKLQGSDTNSQELIRQHIAGDIHPHREPFKATCLQWR